MQEKVVLDHVVTPRPASEGPSVGVDPRHVAVIMDGNGRWATQRSLPRTEGHRHGVDAVRRLVRAAIEEGTEYLTVFSFSSEIRNTLSPPIYN